MKHFYILFLILALHNVNSMAQEQSNYISGYAKTIYGEPIDEDCSCTPEAITAITARCTNDNDYIEWETSSPPLNTNSKSVSFIWSGGYATGTKEDTRTFSLYINDKFTISFKTASRIEGGDWQVNNSQAELNFKNIKYFNRSGNKKDYWGFFILTLPSNELTPGKPIRIKIKGDATGSRYWLRTMEYKLTKNVKIKAENIVSKDSSANQYQRVKITIENYSGLHPVEIFSEGESAITGTLSLGLNTFHIQYKAVKTPVEKSIIIKTGAQVEEYKITLKPVKEITFYVLPHSHVDIGYTELQTEVEKKQWKSIDEAIKLAELTANYKNNSAFKWNVEVLWAVKSYLENFPEKKAAFFEAVKKGCIGLDATYLNLLTGLSRPEELYYWLTYSNQLEKEAGIKIESAMISDVPGLTWGTVQAFADNGVKYFSVGTNLSDRIGNTLKTWGDKPFYWESPSGKDKILVWLAGKGYSWFHNWDITKGDVSPLVDYLENLEAKNYPYKFVQLRYTTGDNGGPNKLLPDFVTKWNETHVTPLFKIATAEEMFKDFEKEYASIIPTYKGDFTPYWEDGAASSAKETAMNRNTAELLTQLEVLYSLTDFDHFPFNEFDEAWRNVLLYSEHTWGAYNSISEPEENNVKEQWQIKKSHMQKADSIADNLLKYFQSDGNGAEAAKDIQVWNSNSWQRSDVVTIPSTVKKDGNYLVDETGKYVETQKLYNGDIVFIARNIPPFSSRNYRFAKTEPGKKQQIYSSVCDDIFTDNGIPKSIESYIDNKYEYPFNGFIHTGKNAAHPKTNSHIKIASQEMGPVINSITYQSIAPGCNSLKSTIKTFAGIDKVEIVNEIDKKKEYEKENIRFAFPFNIENPVTRIDIAWSVIQPEKDQIAGSNKNYFSVQRWIDVSNDKQGITLASPDAPFFEIGGMYAEVWAATSKNIWEEHTKSSSKLFSWVMNNSWHTNYKAAQEGVSTFRYSLMPHKQFQYSSAYKFGVEQSQPLLVTYLKKKNTFDGLIKLKDNSQIVITSLKPAKDKKGYIVRLYNPTQDSCELNLNCRNENTKVFISNGDEEEVKPLNNNSVLAAFEVITLKIKKADN